MSMCLGSYYHYSFIACGTQVGRGQTSDMGMVSGWWIPVETGDESTGLPRDMWMRVW